MHRGRTSAPLSIAAGGGYAKLYREKERFYEVTI